VSKPRTYPVTKAHLVAIKKAARESFGMKRARYVVQMMDGHDDLWTADIGEWPNPDESGDVTCLTDIVDTVLKDGAKIDIGVWSEGPEGELVGNVCILCRFFKVGEPEFFVSTYPEEDTPTEREPQPASAEYDSLAKGGTQAYTMMRETLHVVATAGSKKERRKFLDTEIQYRYQTHANEKERGEQAQADRTAARLDVLHVLRQIVASS